MKLEILGRLLVLASCVFAATGLAAQGAPVPALQGVPSPMFVTDLTDSPVTPDEHPLTGGQSLGIGSWGPKHSTLTPSLSVSETLDSNPLLLNSSSGGYKGFTNFGGGVQWTEYIGRDLEIRYVGALQYDTRARLQGYRQLTHSQSGIISRNIQFRTWNLQINDEVQYSLGSNFSASGMGSMVNQTGQSGLSNMPLPTSLQPNLLPNQSILTGQVGRVANTALVELDAHLNEHNIATLVASYGLLRFDSSLLTGTEQASIVAGYNRTVTARDSIGLEGAYTRFLYQDSSASISTETFSLRYARRISGRSSVEVGGGPEVTQSRFSQPSQSYLGWQGRATLQYRLHRLNLSAQAVRTVSAGAGVLQGATSNTGQGAVDCLLTQYLSMSLKAGVSRNQQLDTAQGYDTQYAGFVVNRKSGRYAGLFISYDFQRQTTSSVCTGAACSYAGLRNVFGIGFSWNYRPIGTY